MVTGSVSAFFTLFHTNVRSIIKKRMIPKCSNLTLGYPTSDMVLVEKSKVKVRVMVRVNSNTA